MNQICWKLHRLNLKTATVCLHYCCSCPWDLWSICARVLTLGHLIQLKGELLAMEPRASVTSFKDIPVRRWSLRSSCSLPYGSFANSLASLTPDAEEKPAISPKRAYVTMFVLCYVNLLNYMERYTIAGWMISLSIQTIYCFQLGGAYTEWYFWPYRCPYRYSKFLWYKGQHSWTSADRYDEALMEIKFVLLFLFLM